VYFAANPGTAPKDRIRLFRSYDRGSNFTTPVNVGADYFLDNDELDKPWLAVDNFSGSGNGNVYLVFLNNWLSSQSQQQSKGIYFYRSLDHGTNWTDRYFFPDTGTNSDAHFPFITVSPNHSVYALYYQKSSQSIQARRGAAQGTSWSSLPTIALSSSGGFGGAWFLDIRTWSAPDAPVVRNVCSLQAAASPVRAGEIYLVYPDQSAVGGDKADIFLRVLSNGAWSQAVRVNNPGNTTTNNKDQWNPVVAVKPNGTELFVGYYDRSADGNNTLVHVAGRIGTIDQNGNVTFGTRIQISASSFTLGDPLNETDYDTVAADNTGFYYSWTDDRNRMQQGGVLLNENNVRFTKISSP
jgi:hypothetical protein